MTAGGRSLRREHLLWGAGSTAIVIYALVPVAWLASLSLKPGAELGNGRFLPRDVSLEHYLAVLRDPQFSAALWNSVGIAGISTILAVLLGMLVAYAVVRLQFRGRGAILATTLAIAMFPPVSIVGPLFNMWRNLGLYDTWTGLVLPYMTFTLPLAIWILAAFFREIPWDLEKAARVDGATPLQAFVRVIVPLTAPGLFTTAILVFMFAWNDFLFAISLTSTDAARTAPASIAFFTGSSLFELPTGSVAAAAMIVTVPVIVVVAIFQRRIVAGLTAGAVKG